MSEAGKYNAAKIALKYVKDGMVLGLGSGSTVEIFLKLLKERINQGMEIYAVPSSVRSKIIAVETGIKIVDLCEHPTLDLCIDGADQVDAKLNCIKGGGAAMTREKIVAAASRKVVIIVDETKVSRKLTHFVPVEILPFSLGFLLNRIGEFISSEIERVTLREGKGKLGPVVTDNGNFILDCHFKSIEDAEKLEGEINSVPGVIENGLFPCRMISCVVVGKNSGADVLSS